MESIPKDLLFEFNPDTLHYLRKQYDLDKPGRIEEAVDILEEWIKKQNHFVIKSFPRNYLERAIIISKGSVERAKTKLDRICTFRTLFSDFFVFGDIANSSLLDDLYGIFLPKLTKDHYRVYLLKNKGKSFKTGFLDFYRYFFMQCEYIQAHDYCNGIELVLDYTEINMMETLKWFRLVDLQECYMIMREGYGMRLKGIHFISESMAVDAIVVMFKQVLSAKVAGRIRIHKNIDSILNLLGKDIMPMEYGGNEKSMLELHKKNQDVLSSVDFTAYLNAMRKACTNESLRATEKHADQYMGIPGSFRALSVD